MQDFFELGVILLRKKLFTQATRNLEKAKKSWEGEEDELAKVHSPTCVPTQSFSLCQSFAGEWSCCLDTSPHVSQAQLQELLLKRPAETSVRVMGTSRNVHV